MIPVVTPNEMRAIDRASTVPVEVLIDRAGAAVARVALRMLGGGYGRTVAVIAGPGNNGADGRIAAHRLRERGVSVCLFDAGHCPPVLPAVDLVVDAAYGTGFRGQWDSPDVRGAKVLAVDVPSGLDALTGEVGAGTLRADITVTFAAAKPGQFLNGGPDVVGELVVVDIGLPVETATVGVVEASDVAAWMTRRRRTAHKWDHAVRIVAGHPGMTGAGWLAAAAAQRVGAGMVMLSSPGVDSPTPIEVVGKLVPAFDWANSVLADLHRFHALVVGPGLGRDDETVPTVVRTVTGAPIPVVVDGDGLFAVARSMDALLDRRRVTILTPHDGEYGLLMGARPDADRIASARRLVDACGAIVLLKGPTTVIAGPDGRTFLITNGDQRLATAGTGDVLAGTIGGLLAMGIEPIRAAAAGAWIHAAASAHCAPIGMIASDLIDQIPVVLTALGKP